MLNKKSAKSTSTADGHLCEEIKENAPYGKANLFMA